MITRIIIIGWISLVFVVLFTFTVLFIDSVHWQEKITWGANFSILQARNLGLDYREVLGALLDDLGVRHFRIPVYWTDIEREEGRWNFDEYDTIFSELAKRNATAFVVVGLKVPRWPECHEPEWIRNQKLNIKNQKLLEYVAVVVNRYKDNPAIQGWQVENEYFFPFGECPKPDYEFYRKEVRLVRALDSKPILIADSGEGSFWFVAAHFGDIVGTTLYRRVWSHKTGQYFTYPFPPVFYGIKAQIVKKLFGDDVFVIELQAEPWTRGLLGETSREDQRKTMDMHHFLSMIDFARQTSLDTFYFWGPEWWYWLKKNYPGDTDIQIWEEAKKLFQQK